MVCIQFLDQFKKQVDQYFQLSIFYVLPCLARQAFIFGLIQKRSKKIKAQKLLLTGARNLCPPPERNSFADVGISFLRSKPPCSLKQPFLSLKNLHTA